MVKHRNLRPQIFNIYIGNIFYNTGLITITETGSWSGSGTANGIDYTVVGTGTFNINFKSTQTLYVRSFEIDIDPTEFLGTNNPTIRQKTTEPGTEASSSVLGTPFTIPEITTGASGSKWAPYMTTVGFYDANKQLVMVGRYPQPIKMRDDMKLILRETKQGSPNWANGVQIGPNGSPHWLISPNWGTYRAQWARTWAQ